MHYSWVVIMLFNTGLYNSAFPTYSLKNLDLCSVLLTLYLTMRLFIWGELARLGGLAHLGEMIFIPRSYGVFYFASIKNHVGFKRI